MTVAIRPEAGVAREYRFPSFFRRELSNGIPLLVAPIHKLPLVTVLAIVNGGAGADPFGKEGVADLVARALTEGAGALDGEALTDIMEQLGTSINTNADWDATTISMTVVPHKFETALEHFVTVLTVPTFPTSAVERLQGERIAEILQIESEPREYATDKFHEFVYAETSRFRTPVGGSKKSVQALSRDDVLAFYQSRYQPSGVTLIVVGDITIDAAQEMANRALGAWESSSSVTSVKADDSAARTTRMVHVVPRSDAPQSELRIGHVGVPRNHPDYFDVTVMNAILGGLFGSRINLNLREAHGYTYGANSTFDWRRAAGPFVISTAVASNVTVEAIKETLYEIDRMRTAEVSPDELTLATNYLDGVFPIRYETTAAVAAALSALVIFELPDDWYDTYRANIREMTPKRVLSAAQRYIDPEQLQIVIVGDAEAIETPLATANFAPVLVHHE